jgi:hypothetical protein
MSQGKLRYSYVITQNEEKVDKLQKLGHVHISLQDIQMSEGTKLMYDSKMHVLSSLS